VTVLADGARKTRVLSLTRVLFVLTVVGGQVAGYIGIDRYLSHPPSSADVRELSRGFWNIVYYDLQLFVLGSEPLQHAGPYPWPLNVARFAAPLATVYALFEAARALFDERYHRWRRAHRRAHAIITGDTPAAAALVARLCERTDKNRFIHIDAGDIESLRAAGIRAAGVVYACADDSGDSTLNVATAQAAATAKRRRWGSPSLRIYAQVSDPTLALALRARWLGLAECDRPDVDFFNVDELAARGSLSNRDFEMAPGRSPHILVAGLGTFGRAVLVEYALQWRLRRAESPERVAVTLVDPDAEAAKEEMLARWDVVREVCDITAANGGLEPVLRMASGPAPHRTYVCYEDEDLALRTALTAVRLWRGEVGSVVVRLNRLARHEVLTSSSQPNLLNTVDGRLRLASVTELGCRPEIIHEDLVERLAQSIHQHYLLEQKRKNPTQTGGALKPWKDLLDTYKRANRAQARDIGAKLVMINATVGPRTDAGLGFTFTDDEVEQLAIHEHTRWHQERLGEGVRLGARNEHHTRNPDLVDWSELPEPERQKDREAIRNMIAVLADVGLQVVRLGDAKALGVAEPGLSVPATV
jgi:RyR domain-containing protein